MPVNTPTAVGDVMFQSLNRDKALSDLELLQAFNLEFQFQSLNRDKALSDPEQSCPACRAAAFQSLNRDKALSDVLLRWDGWEEY